MTDADELAAIRSLIDAGDDDAALERLRARLRWPRGKQLGDLASWLALLGDLVERRGAAPLAELARLAVRDPDSPDLLYDLGYALIDAGAPAIAASVLWHCLALVGDSEEVVCELVSALETALAHEDAFAILEHHAALRERSFLCEYLFAFNAAMTGRLDVTRAAFARLAPDTPETEIMRDTIGGIVGRADQVAGLTSLGPRDLRGWQYVLTGARLSHLSPYGFDEPMHGRYAWLRDSLALVRTGIERLVPLASAARVPCVYAPPGRDHEILSHAVASRLGLPLAPWPAIGVPAPGLVVVYDLGAVRGEDLARLVQRKADQIVYAHACPWTRDVPIAPDVCTLLYQSLVPAWGEQVFDVPNAREVREPPDMRAPEQVAADILASSGLDSGESASDDPATWGALIAATWPPAPGRRSRWWAGGPVPSNRFV